jgi:hypothetical protein
MIYLRCFGLSSLILACALLGGCSDLVMHADELARPSGLIRREVRTKSFVLTAYTRIKDGAQPYNIYIEGDGLAWKSPNEPSMNPTPHKALALSLATEDPTGNVIYIARPCQFTPPELNPKCGIPYWTDRRFSEEVVVSINQAIDKLVPAGSSQKLNLIGYSGGAAVAVLSAARRSDVVSIRTVAGNLDHAEVNRRHDVSQLEGSLNAIDEAPRITSIPQIHFFGAEDDVISPEIGERFMKASSSSPCIHLQTLKGVTHEDGWIERWPDLLKQPLTCDGH